MRGRDDPVLGAGVFSTELFALEKKRPENAGVVLRCAKLNVKKEDGDDD